MTGELFCTPAPYPAVLPLRPVRREKSRLYPYFSPRCLALVTRLRVLYRARFFAAAKNALKDLKKSKGNL
jgi:hypothetical protein